MAEGKKSFILYADLIHTVSKLPKEKAGELFLHILEYVNDKNPTTDDLILQLAFEPVKLQLKRDLEKWDDIRDKRGKAGKKSAEIRQQKQHMLTHVEFAEQTSTNPTVTVNVNDTVTVNDSVINNSAYNLAHFNKQGYSFPISGKVASEIDRFLNYRAKHQLHGPIKSGEQVEAIILNFKDLNYTDEMISRAITDTIAKGAKNIICEQKPVTQQTTAPKIKNLT